MIAIEHYFKTKPKVKAIDKTRGGLYYIGDKTNRVIGKNSE